MVAGGGGGLLLINLNCHPQPRTAHKALVTGLRNTSVGKVCKKQLLMPLSSIHSSPDEWHYAITDQWSG